MEEGIHKEEDKDKEEIQKLKVKDKDNSTLEEGKDTKCYLG